MKNKLFPVAIMWVMLVVMCPVVKAGGESEGQRARNAEKLFLAKKYDKATLLYAQLVSSNPKNFKYNYRYGMCVLLTGKDKSKALPYLEAALQNPKTPEDVYYYIGRALHYTYRFDESIQALSEFRRIIGAKNAGRWNSALLLQMCNNAKQILDTSKFSLILNKSECPANSFYSFYSFENPNGKLLTMPDEMVKSSKSKKGERSNVFLSANGRVMYYSAINNENNSRDIYRSEKDVDDKWTTPTRLDISINTNEEELFPTCNSDGRILYFSSRGHNSTGGFDIFKTYYNTISKTWSNPENMGSPYNSPDDDFCFVASSEECAGYFTSQRETGLGSLTVYKVKFDKKEELPVAIHGKFTCIGYPKLRGVKLMVTCNGTGKTVADVMSDSANGTYSIELPGPGTYAFRVEAPGFKPHTEEVTYGEFSDRTYVQDIFLSRSISGLEDLAISNRRITDWGLIDESLTASGGLEDDMGIGLSDAAREVAKLSRSGEWHAGSGLDANGNPIKGADGQSGNTNGHTSGMNGEMNGGVHNGSNPNGSMHMNGLIYKVQIGAFQKNNRDIVKKQLEDKTDKTMLSSYDDSNWLRFYMGAESTYNSAQNLCETLRQAGFNDAFIVAFRDNKPVNLSTLTKSADAAND